jgi:hypothetical protein
MMTREEHLRDAKKRALEYLPDYIQAMTSFVSDLGKHDELRDHPVIMLLGMHAFSGLLNARECRNLIEGTN